MNSLTVRHTPCHSAHTKAQLTALANFETACADWQQGCIGITRKENNARAVVVCHAYLCEHGVADALTQRELATVSDARSYLGMTR